MSHPDTSRTPGLHVNGVIAGLQACNTATDAQSMGEIPFTPIPTSHLFFPWRSELSILIEVYIVPAGAVLSLTSVSVRQL
jgi:hypothetical protein